MSGRELAAHGLQEISSFFEVEQAEFSAEKDQRRFDFNAFQPTNIQLAAISSQEQYRSIVGKNQVGKSFIIAYEAAACLEGKHPYRSTGQAGDVFFICINSREQIRDVYGPYLLERSNLLPKNGVPDPQSDVPLLHADDIKVLYDRSIQPPVPKTIIHKRTKKQLRFIISSSGKREKFERGKRYAGGWIDEDGCTSELYHELLPRLLAAHERDKSLGWLSWYVSQVAVCEAADMFREKAEKNEDGRWLALRAESEVDDPISKESRDAIASAMDSTQARIRMQGIGSIRDNLSLFPSLTERKRYISDKWLPVFNDDNIWVGFDFGMVHPAGLVFAHTQGLPDGDARRLVVKQCYCFAGKSIRWACDLISDYLQGRKMVGMVYDKYANRRGDIDSPKPLDVLREYFTGKYWAVGRAQFLSVQQGPESYDTMLSYFDPPHGCPNVIFDLPTAENGIELLYSQLRRMRGRYDPREPGPHGIYRKGIGDDGADGLRLIMGARPRWRSFGPIAEIACGYQRRVAVEATRTGPSTRPQNVRDIASEDAEFLKRQKRQKSFQDLISGRLNMFHRTHVGYERREEVAL